MAQFDNPYHEPVGESPGQAEVKAGQYLVMIFRLFKIKMPYKADVKSVARTGELVRRWWRTQVLRMG